MTHVLFVTYIPCDELDEENSDEIDLCESFKSKTLSTDEPKNNCDFVCLKNEAQAVRETESSKLLELAGDSSETSADSKEVNEAKNRLFIKATQSDDDDNDTECFTIEEVNYICFSLT